MYDQQKPLSIKNAMETPHPKAGYSLIGLHDSCSGWSMEFVAYTPGRGLSRKVLAELLGPQISRRCVHGLFLITTGGRRKVSDINILVLLKLLQTGHNSLLDEILASGRGCGDLAGLFHLRQGLIRGQTAQRVD